MKGLILVSALLMSARGARAQAFPPAFSTAPVVAVSSAARSEANSTLITAAQDICCLRVANAGTPSVA